MKLKITIDMDNAAFHDQPSGCEVARILRYIANDCEGQDMERGAVGLRDINGNSVGTLQVTR